MGNRKTEPAAVGEVVTTIRFPAAIHEQVAQAALDDRRSINAEILYLLEQMLAIRQRRIERNQREE